MPTKELYRTWCKNCQDWEIHYTDSFNNSFECKECGTIYSTIKLNEIPEAKILEQRERYKNYKRESLRQLFSNYILMTDLIPSNNKIIENDAGQKRIDEEETRLKNEAYEKEKEEERQYNEKFKGINRNDKCRCGSGKKFKKCCIK